MRRSIRSSLTPRMVRFPGFNDIEIIFHAMLRQATKYHADAVRSAGLRRGAALFIVRPLMDGALTCWTLTEGHAGAESQCRGLAEALGLAASVKRVRVRRPWSWLPGRLWLRPLAAPTADSDPLAPPWPDLLISCGNAAAPLAVAIKRASGGRTRIVHIQNPRINVGLFDVVVAPRHDGLAGDNVLSTRLAIHPVARAKLAAAGAEWSGAFAALPRPLVGVLIGGGNRRYRLSAEAIARLTDQLARLRTAHGAGLAITPSRRTGAANEATLNVRLSGSGAYIWDGCGANPYLGILALADVLVVTQDSVSMTSEAIATNKPVYIFKLPGYSRRIGAFHDWLVAEGITRWFDGSLARWEYPPVDDTEAVAREIRRRFGWK